MNRRKFLAVSAGTSASLGSGLPPGRASDTDLVESITQETLWRNRDGRATTWFHPRACLVPDGKGSRFALMNLQEIGGSDYFGPVHWSRSDDLGRSWTDPEPVPSLGRIPVPGHEGDGTGDFTAVEVALHRDRYTGEAVRGESYLLRINCVQAVHTLTS